MKLSNYKKPFILVGFYYGFEIFFNIFNAPNQPGVIPFMPGDAATQSWLMTLIIYPASAIIGSLLIGYILIPLFLLVHTKILGRSYQYGIQEKNSPKKFKKTFQAFFPTILAVNLAMFLASNPSIVGFILHPSYIHAFFGGINIFAFLILMNLTIGIGMGLFSPAWFLSDAGITFSNKKKIDNTDFPHEIRSISRVYLTVLKGYGGIGVIIAYIRFIYTYITDTIAYFGYFDPLDIIFLIGPLLWPFNLTCGSTLSIIVLDLIKQKRIKYVRKVVRKFDILDTIDISLEIRNK